MLKKYLRQTLLTGFLSAAAITFTAAPAFAADIRGGLNSADETSVTGWAYNKEDFDDVLQAELHIYNEEGAEVAVITAAAENYREDLSQSIKDGWHSFTASVNWNELPGNTFEIKAYGISGEEKAPLSDFLTYRKNGTPSYIIEDMPIPIEEDPSSQEPETPDQALTDTEAASEDSSDSENSAAASVEKGQSLGMFTTTGYCSCQHCSSGQALTYSGTVPKPEHTISADLERFPLGTRLMINDIIYTVEDKGTNVNGNKIDIYYGSHEEAYAHGVETVEVFSVK